MLKNDITSDTLLSSSDVVENGRFILNSFNGSPTGMFSTVSKIMDVFLSHQSQMIQKICEDLGIVIQEGVVTQLPDK